jgi:hypothetical protein
MSERRKRISFCLKGLINALGKEKRAGWVVAEMLYEIQKEEYWRDLKYLSFSIFIGKVTGLALGDARQRVKDFEKVMSLGITSLELQTQGYMPSYIRVLFDLDEPKKAAALKLLRSKNGMRKFASAYMKKEKGSRSDSLLDLRRAAIVLNASSAEVAEETKKLLQEYCQEKKESFTCDALLSLLRTYSKGKRSAKVQSRGLLLPRSRVGSEARM